MNVRLDTDNLDNVIRLLNDINDKKHIADYLKVDITIYVRDREIDASCSLTKYNKTINEQYMLEVL